MARGEPAASSAARAGDRDRASLVERAHRTGELRPDVDALDLLVVLRMLAGVAAAPELSPDRVRRYVDLVLCGLRPD